ncbi:hypothetical protein WN51_06182 [Melipona quadrifasciata]|uniref:Uncharacterized protein n=1 Tax=Melipona quadrifasciata TaxID=166423 RepID=A0A0N0U3H2_9HYME|nr:hypothetical protein WN51_06182 [Melipona quadrifasciata]
MKIYFVEFPNSVFFPFESGKSPEETIRSIERKKTEGIRYLRSTNWLDSIIERKNCTFVSLKGPEFLYNLKNYITLLRNVIKHYSRRMLRSLENGISNFNKIAKTISYVKL